MVMESAGRVTVSSTVSRRFTTRLTHSRALSFAGHLRSSRFEVEMAAKFFTDPRFYTAAIFPRRFSKCFRRARNSTTCRSASIVCPVTNERLQL